MYPSFSEMCQVLPLKSSDERYVLAEIRSSLVRCGVIDRTEHDPDLRPMEYIAELDRLTTIVQAAYARHATTPRPLTPSRAVELLESLVEIWARLGLKGAIVRDETALTELLALVEQVTLALGVLDLPSAPREGD